MNEVMKERGTILQGYQVFGKEETLEIYKDERVKEMALKYHKTTRQNCDEISCTKGNKCHYKTNAKTMDER